MSKKLRNGMILGIVIGIAAIPIVRYLRQRKAKAQGENDNQPQEPQHATKGLFSAYRSQHKPHHRHASTEGGQD